MKCFYDDHCEINIHNRHVCSACRLVKCFASGMQVEMLRSSGTRKNKKRQHKQVTTVSNDLPIQDQPEQVRFFSIRRFQYYC